MNPLALIRYVRDYGFATVVAILLLWVILFRSPDVLSRKVDAQTVMQQQLGEKFDEHAKLTIEGIDTNKDYNDRMLRFMYLMCLNTAHSQSARDACEAVLK